MVLADGFFFHELGIPTSTEILLWTVIAKEEAKIMAIMFTVFKALFAKIGSFIDGAIVAYEDRVISSGDFGAFRKAFLVFFKG